MKALLINPWVYDFACYDLFNKPLGLLKIASLLKDNGLKVELIDSMDRFHPALTKFLGKEASKYQRSPCGNYYSEETGKPSLFKDIPRKYKRHGMPEQLFRKLAKRSGRPDIILVTSGMTYWYQGVFEAIEASKEMFPGVPVMLGGVYATLCREHALRNSGADIIFRGTDLTSAARLLSEIGGRKIECARDHYAPAYELYPELKYATLRTSNGCPFKCSYCAWHLLDPKLGQDTPEDTISDISGLYKRGIKNFAFYDEALFYAPDKHITPILEGILDNGIKARFYTPNGLHARFVTEELASLLKKCGFVEPRLGFESSDRKRQSATGGKVYSEELSKAVSYLRKAGYREADISVYLLIGLPEQSHEEVEGSIRFVNSLKVRARLEEYSPVPGTPDHKRCGLPEDADPLLHNNSAFPLYGRERFSDFQKLKGLKEGLNKRIKYSIIG